MGRWVVALIAAGLAPSPTGLRLALPASMHNSEMYRIWCSSGKGTWRGPCFRHYTDALRYVDEHRSEFSSAIHKPNGGIVHMASRVLCRAAQPVLHWPTKMRVRTVR
jgi:hypothetical protein